MHGLLPLGGILLAGGASLGIYTLPQLLPVFFQLLSLLKIWIVSTWPPVIIYSLAEELLLLGVLLLGEASATYPIKVTKRTLSLYTLSDVTTTKGADSPDASGWLDGG